MAATNPPPIRVPKKLAEDRESFAYFNELHTFLRLLWTRTGGGEDLIGTSGDAITALALDLALANTEIDGLGVDLAVASAEIDALEVDQHVAVTVLDTADVVLTLADQLLSATLTTAVNASLALADSAVQEAVIDGQQYARQSGAWAVVAADPQVATNVGDITSIVVAQGIQDSAIALNTAKVSGTDLLPLANTWTGLNTFTAGLKSTGAGADSFRAGTNAGATAQGANGIIISGTGAALNDTTPGHIHIASSLSSIDYTSSDGWRLSGQSIVVADVVAASSDFAEFQARIAAIQHGSFTSVWATTTSSETITIPCQNVGTFNAVIDWGDGTANSTITTYNDVDLAHVYATAGDHTISITGTFPNIYFNNVGDKLKIKKVLNLGTVGWTSLVAAFRGCTNLTEFTAGSTDTSNVASMGSLFRNCSGLTSIDVSSFNTTNVTDMAIMFTGCSGLTSIDLSSFVTTSATSMPYMFQSCSLLTSIVGAEDFDITGLNSTGDLTNFITVGKMTTAQYDNLLVNWEAQAVFAGMSPSFGASKYTGGSAAATARAALISADGWTITDGGTV